MVCRRCEQEKDQDEFSWRKKNINRATICKACHRIMAKMHYQNNKEYYKKKSNQNRKSYKIRGKKFLIEYLQSHPCVDCGEDDIEVLQFDHTIELNNWKAPRVTSLVAQSLNKIKEEIAKCDVRCANCHVRKTRRLAGTLRMTR